MKREWSGPEGDDTRLGPAGGEELPGGRAWVRSLITPGARLEIWELLAHRVLEVAGMVRAEGL